MPFIGFFLLSPPCVRTLSSDILFPVAKASRSIARSSSLKGLVSFFFQAFSAREGVIFSKWLVFALRLSRAPWLAPRLPSGLGTVGK